MWGFSFLILHPLRLFILFVFVFYILANSAAVSRGFQTQLSSDLLRGCPSVTPANTHTQTRGSKRRLQRQTGLPGMQPTMTVTEPSASTREEGWPEERKENKLWKATFFPACRHYRGNRGKGLTCSVGVFLAATEDLWNNRKPFTLCLVRTWLSTYASMLC